MNNARSLFRRYSRPQRRAPRPYDWGVGMTVCIAAIAERRKELVIASDSMVSLLGGTFSADATMAKGGNLVPGRWAALFAGDDVTSVQPVIERARKRLASIPMPSQEEVAVALAREYQVERTARAVAAHLSIYQLDMPTFLANGEGIFGESGFGILRERIESVLLEFSLLVAGFNELDEACVFGIEHPGIVLDFTDVGYWAIGSGAVNALGRLSIRQQRRTMSCPKTIYNVCEAKVAAESALGVGMSTGLIVVQCGRSAGNVSAETMEAVREVCLASLRPRIPEELIERIKSSTVPPKPKASAPPQLGPKKRRKPSAK